MPLRGSTVVSKHKSAVAKCRDKSGWEALECIVDAMHEEYKE
jgi:hypothetical protein